MPRFNTILMIEEDAATRFMMRKIARALDIEVEMARSCHEGLVRLREKPSQFAMIFVNLELCPEGHDGTVQSIRADPHRDVRETPIIGVLDAFESDDRPVAVGEEGVNESLIKPVTPAELLSLVDRYFSPLVTQG